MKHHNDLLPREQLATEIAPAAPITTELARGDQLIVCMGVQHRSELMAEGNINQEQAWIAVIRRGWEDFVERTDGHPDRLALNEGRLREVRPGESDMDTYLKGGEPALLTRWAEEANIPVESAEPPNNSEVVHMLEQGFSTDVIVSHYSIRQMCTWASREPRPDADQYHDETLQKFKQSLTQYPEFENFEFSPDHMLYIHNQLFPDWEYDPEHPEFLKRARAARYRFGDEPTQRAAYACQEARDLYKIDTLEQKLGKCVFDLSGWRHRLAIMPGLARIALEHSYQITTKVYTC
jgi:hypothetical protein